MIVYRHRRNDTNKVFYIGIGTSNQRPYTKRGRSQLWKNITNKTGYSVEILATGLSKKDAVELEVFLIQEYDGLCNWTKGGEVGALGYKHTPDALKKISEASKGRKIRKLTPEQKLRISKSCTGMKRSYVSDLKSKKVYQYTKDGLFIRSFKSAIEAQIKTGISESNICSARNGKRKTAGGYIWKLNKET